MKNIPDESVDLILTDPPYGINYQSRRRKKICPKIYNDRELGWLETFFSECFRVLKNDSAIYVFSSWHHIEHFKLPFQKWFNMKNLIVWLKNNHGSGDLKCAYAPQSELVLYGNKGRCALRGGRTSDVIFAKKTRNLYHPTQKPTELLEKFIRNSSDDGFVVLDPFMGSGSTGVACVNTGRNFIGIELDGGYFETAKKRIEAAASEENK